MAEVCLRTPACKLKEWSCSFKQQSVLWNRNYTVFLTPVRSCCEWPSEITRNKGNNGRERCTSFLSSIGNQDFYGTYVYKNNHVDFTLPSRSYSAHLGSTECPAYGPVGAEPVPGQWYVLLQVLSITWVLDWPGTKVRIQTMGRKQKIDMICTYFLSKCSSIYIIFPSLLR